MTAIRRGKVGALEVVVEENPHAATVALGYFVRTGARDEPPELEGVSHFLEHMCFKGTPTRDALAINRALDEMGAQANAWTSWEETAYYVHVLPEKARDGIELLSDMMRPALRKEDFDLEKNVILEEIAMYEDRPDYLLFDHALAHRFAGHPLGRRILGRPETIRPMTVEAMRDYHAARYAPGGLAFVASGAVSYDAIAGAVAEATAGWIVGTAPSRARPAPPPPPPPKRIARPGDAEVRLVRLWDGPSANEEDATEDATLFARALGDSVGSRLYWALVHPGLAEEASAFHEPFDGCGVLGVVLVARRANYEKAREVLEAALAEAAAKPPDAEEIARAKRKVRTSILAGAESPLRRFRSLGERVLAGLPLRSAEEVAARYDARPEESVRAVAERLAGPFTEVLFL